VEANACREVPIKNNRDAGILPDKHNADSGITAANDDSTSGVSGCSSAPTNNGPSPATWLLAVVGLPGLRRRRRP
jgi:MYXO-CTERM domain-containing protein